ncbi:uncharacterized protein LOC127287898 [Leptopilina boulardi]|uniref:uncharacterized protein LOC127287898 n=1 Tax=Leptopilina boulardi TaxID=63433 RepID=UPI0021F583DC|nr:uncharacterized protein LOC127287898 [Leptopilina boulardi]
MSTKFIPSWREKNEKYVVGILHKTNGSKVFLDSWDFTQNSETATALKEVIDSAIIYAKQEYNTNIYAVVTDNVASMTSVGNNIDCWFGTCHSHSGNLLAKSLIGQSFNAELVSVFKEFKTPKLERELINRGGIRIFLPGDTRWCSYRDSFRCYLRNLNIM